MEVNDYVQSLSGDGVETSLRSFSANDKLTVAGPSKIESQLPVSEDSGRGASRWITVLRWLVMIVLCLGFLSCLVLSKVAALSLGQQISFYRNSGIHDQRPNSSSLRDRIPGAEGSPQDATAQPSQSTVYGIESSFLWILIVLCVPNATTFVFSLFKGATRHDRPWPSAGSLLLGFCSCVAESFGLILFTIEVMSETPMGTVVSLMNGVFSLPLLFQLFQPLTDRSVPRRKCWEHALLGLGVLFEIAGIALIVGIVVHPNGLRVDIGDIWEIPVALLLLSFAWSPSIQKRLLYPQQSQLESLWRRNRSRESNEQVPEASSVIFIHPELSARWKNAAIMSSTRLVLIPAVGFLYVYARQLISFTNLRSGFLNLVPEHPMFAGFLANVFSSLVGSVLGAMACTMCMQKLAFAVPLVLTTPVACVLVVLQQRCLWSLWTPLGGCSRLMRGELLLFFLVPATVCLVLAQVFSTAVFIFKTQTIVMQKLSHLFWLPGYNAIFLEQCFLLDRKNIQTNGCQQSSVEKARNSHVIICTTMYREAAHEMEQLLRSIKAINRAKQLGDRRFEAHIFFDNGTRGTRLTEFALQLACIVKRTLDVESSQCTKVMMPYGIRLTWLLPEVVEGKHGMALVIHLKDNLKVRNKKRWSQVMYMSYVIDYFLREETTATLDNTFILTTDADVKFTPESVEALLDLMVRDDKVGAVCSRTYPLGSGPVYWFQIFDYAVGHWFQKAANHVLGSVLCCPGCFSVYRVEAVKDILPIYGSQVEKASEFLTKDMGEDRWLCTLMVQCGWRLEYCAAASNSTYCPEEFDEFFKQRRRWIPSTLANQVLLLQEWKTLSYFNKNISIFFMLYQALLLFSSLINPSVSILVIVGGLQFAWSLNPVATTLVMIAITVAYAIVCLYCSQDNQLLVAKVLTCVFAMIMAAVFIGTIAQIAEEEGSLNTRNVTTIGLPGPPPSSPGCDTGIRLPLSVTTLYLSGLVAIFVLTAVMHLPEAYCLVHGAWYLFCLPAGNLFLMIYSICNITDRSWGTREEKKTTSLDLSVSWTTYLQRIMRKIFFCFKFDDPVARAVTASKATQTQSRQNPLKSDTEDESAANGDACAAETVEGGKEGRLESIKGPRSAGSFIRKSELETQFHFDCTTFSRRLSVKDWLPSNLKSLYSEAFEMNGYDDTSFLSGVTDGELREIGVKTTGHRNALMQAIRLLPDFEIEPYVPKDIGEWLQDIGLSMYTKRFLHSHIVSPSNMEVLKSMSVEEMKRELGIVKRGHLKRFLFAISRLRYPTSTELQVSETRNELNALRLFDLASINSSEFEFWEKLRQEKLSPDSGAFAHDADLKTKLEELRNSTLLVYAVANVIWLILIMTLASKSDRLNVLCTNPLGLTFLVIFGLLTCIQFLCMIAHRLSTWMHMIARAPDRCGQPNNASWAFKDADFRRTQEDDEDLEARREREELNRRLRERYDQSVFRRHFSVLPQRQRNRSNREAREPLLASETANARHA